MGILNFIKSAFSNTEKQPPVEEVRTIPAAFSYDTIIAEAHEERKAKGDNLWWSIKPSQIEIFTGKILSLTHKEKVGFITWSVAKIHAFNRNRRQYNSGDYEYNGILIIEAFMQHLLKTRLVLDDEDIDSVVSAFMNFNKYDHGKHVLYWPVNLLVNQVEKQIRDRPVSEKLREVLLRLRTRIQEQGHSKDKDQAKVLARIDSILFSSDSGNMGVKPTYFPGNDEFGNYANSTIKAMSDNDQQNWFRLMLHAQKASGGKPSKKYVDEVKVLFKAFGADKFKQQVNEWFLFITAMKEKIEEHQSVYGTNNYTYTTSEFVCSPNIDIIKGFIWSCVHFHDKATLFNIAQLAERAYRKIPGKGPAAAAIGNACLYVLANTKGLDGVGHLSRLKLRIKQSSTQNIIEKYLLEAATEQGVSIYEIEDMAVDDHDLQHAKKEYEFDGYKAVLEITGVGKTTLTWFKPDGTPQKAVPAAVKEKYAAKLKKLKDTTKQIELTVSAQRDRLDRMFKSKRSLTGTAFNEFYFSHGLMCYLAHKIIWCIEISGNKQAVFFLNGKWCNNNNEPIAFDMDDNVLFSLWHPVFASVEEIKTWREFMMQHKIVQPLKQAFREVYLLTDAEINTVTYSNRMAAHILKQHQFNSLAKTRGWKYSLMGAFDNGGYNQFASTELKEYSLRAEFWVNEVNADNAFNDTGIWNYIATDQVRFTDTATGNVKELIEIPAVVLTEVMRDVDLFVGVASVGNDPNWRDGGGLTAYHDYWQSYSFGELTEVAKTRKSILEGLVPRLKIAKVAELKDKFLVVKGKLRTYKIHLGSTNILMEPNDQYLCIVPDRSKQGIAENIFLPFEGDNGLSVILSKAMLLAEDDKITDTTITSQINRK